MTKEPAAVRLEDPPLPKAVEDWLEQPRQRPIDSDSDYVFALCVHAYLAAEARKARERCVGVVSTDRRFDRRARDVVESLDRLAAEVQTRLEGRLTVGETEGWRPRLLRLSERYGWSSGELAAFQYMLVQTINLVGEFTDDEIRDAMAATGLGVDEMLEFVNPTRSHIREGLFEVESKLYSTVFRAEFKIHDEVAKALVGAQLDTNDLLKLDGTTLFDVLSDEPEFEPPESEGGTVRTPEEPEWDDELLTDPDDDGGCDEDWPGDLDSVEIGDHDIDPDLEVDDQETTSGVAARLEPYTSDLEYLEDHFRYIAARLRRVGTEQDVDDFRRSNERSKESILRELSAKERVLRQTCELRAERTRASGDWQPRVERLVESRGLDDFEKSVLLTLVGLHLSDDVQKAAQVHGPPRATVGDLLTLWTAGLAEQVNRRRHFYRSGTLVKDGLIRLESGFLEDLQQQDVDIDRRMLEFIVGLDSEAGDLVEGSHLYSPQVHLDHVILPADQKQLVLDTIGSFEHLQRARQQMGLDDAMPYGRGLVMLFYGPSGTGKTMLANAIAHRLGKKIFLVNFPTLGSMWADEVLALLFREARIHEAILFFDECEALFESREHGNVGITTLLTEIERHDGPIIMATNRPFDLDEAMNRRVTLAIEFRVPDPHLRADIWRVHLPIEANVADDVDVEDLARRYEIAGGFIKNAVKSALAFAVARDNDNPRICHGDLDRGARYQLRSRLSMMEMERRIIPSHGLDWLVVPTAVASTLREIADFEKMRNVLYGQWGFDQVDGRGQGVIAVFHGEPGTGKTLAAEAIAYETGRPLRMVNTAELISKYVGDTAKNIDALFTEVRNHDALLLFEEADALFGRRTEGLTANDRYANVDVGLLLHHIERYPGLVVLTTNMLQNIDPAFQRRMRYVVEFPVPSEEHRCRLWRQLLPDATPVSSDVDFDVLGSKFALTGGGIKNAVYRAAARAALRDAGDRVVTMNDLVAAASDETAGWQTRRVGFSSGGE